MLPKSVPSGTPIEDHFLQKLAKSPAQPSKSFLQYKISVTLPDKFYDLDIGSFRGEDEVLNEEFKEGEEYTEDVEYKDMWFTVTSIELWPEDREDKVCLWVLQIVAP